LDFLDDVTGFEQPRTSLWVDLGHGAFYRDVTGAMEMRRALAKIL
jgi:hypothetical protein